MSTAGERDAILALLLLFLVGGVLLYRVNTADGVRDGGVKGA